jgi:uncharacterized protein with HEPN domain
MKTNEVYLHHILDAIEKIEQYTAGVDRSKFTNDEMRQDAVIRQLEIIEEASRQLSASFRESHPSIPWHAIIGMRNRMAHDYLSVDLDVVWDVVRHDLPGLKKKIGRLLEE